MPRLRAEISPREAYTAREILETVGHSTLTVTEVAGWLGCEDEGKLLGEIAGLFGYLIAVSLLCVMAFFIALVLLLKCGAAFGG